MRSRIVLIVVLTGLLGLYPLLAPPPHRIDQSHADLVTKGMSREQVEAIFGVPPGDYDWAEVDGNTATLLFLSDLLLQDSTSIGKVGDIDGDGAVDLNVSTPQSSTLVLDLSGRVLGDLESSSTWTSRNGSFTIWFDSSGRVSSTNMRSDVKIVPPWQHWRTRFWHK
jgi:hypothetical protein